ncbi:cytochrome P450 family protein [Actinosynnema sp. CA-299493]
MIGFSTPTSTKLDSGGGGCMYKQIDELRASAPAVPVELPEGVSAWSVTRGDVVKRLLTHPGISRNLKKNNSDYQPGSIPWLAPWVDVDSMFTAQGHEHTRLRRLIAPAFTPKRIDAMRSQLEAITADLLDDLWSRPGNEPVDLHAAFSHGVPTRLICDLFGVPDDQRAEVLRILRVVVATDVPEDESARLNEDMDRAMRLLIDTKRREPGDDLTSFLLTARVEGEAPLSEQELISTLLLMIGGGSQTTVSLIDHAARELLAHPDQLAVAQADPAKWTDVVEEALRVHCPVMHLPMRWATEDIELGEGVVIHAGDAVLIAFGAHGRDPRLHDNPGEFDIHRANKEHLAFGAGPHFCPGARLARLEAAVALPALFDRFPRLALAVAPDEVEPLRSFIANDVLALPVLLNHR